MWIGWILFGFGGLLCALDFHLSVLRFLIFRARGGRRADYRHVPGFPGIGSATMAIAWFVWLRRLDSGPLDLTAALLVAWIHWKLHDPPSPGGD